jgi:hypothetical protein
MALDVVKVLAYLARWREHGNVLVASVADGLAARIEAGEMDQREEES